MNTTIENNINLTEEQVQEASARLEREFTSDPNFVARLDQILTNVSPGRALRIAAGPLVPAGQNDLNQAFQSLNDLVDEQLQNFSNNEREQIRQRFYNALSTRIKAKLDEKANLYITNVDAIDNSADIMYQAVRNTINQINPLMPTLSTNGIPTVELTNLINRLNLCTRDNITNNLDLNHIGPHLPEPPFFTLQQIVDYKQSLTTIINDLLTSIDTHITTLFPAGTTPTEVTAARDLIANLNTTLLSQIDSYSDSVRTNLVNPNTGNSDISFETLSAGADILREAHNTITTPGIDHLISREVRFTNFYFNQTNPTSPYLFFHPVRSNISDNPYRRGDRFTVNDYDEFYTWYNREKPTLTPERVEAIEENADLQRELFIDPLRESFINHFNAAIATGGVDLSQVKDQVKHSLIQYVSQNLPLGIAGAPAPPLHGGPIPNFNQNIHGTNKNLSLNLNAIALGIDVSSLTSKKIEQSLISEMEQDILLGLNLPDNEDLAELNEANLEAFGENQTDVHRTNLISSSRAKIQIELEEEFKDKNLRDPKVMKEFTKSASAKVLQSRLKAINEVVRPKQNNWYNNIPAKLGLDTKELGLGLGLITGGSLLYGASGIASFFSQTAKSSFAWMQLQGLPALSPIFKVGSKFLGAAAVGAGTFLGARQLANVVGSAMGSRGSGVLQKSDVLGTTSNTGINTGGMGVVDTRNGTYDGATVQRALAEQIAFAESHGATITSIHKNKNIGLISGGKGNFEARYKTADHLWEREQMGLQAIIKYNTNQALLDRSIPKEEKLSVAIARSLNNIYQPNGIEDNFLREFAAERQTSTFGKWGKNIASGVAAGMVAGSLIVGI
jgi:hypothetical protein